MAVIPKISTDTYTYSGSFISGMFYTPNLSFDRAATYSGGTVYIPHVAGLGEVDVSSFTFPDTYLRGFINNRAYAAVATTGMVVQYTNDLTSVIDTVGTITPTVSSTSSAPLSFTYNALSFSWSYTPVLVEATDGINLLAGCDSHTPSASHKDVFCWHFPFAGSATMMKAFQMPIICTDLTGAGNCTILATVPLGARYRSLVRVNISGVIHLYVADWAPTSIGDTVYDATLTEVTLSDSTDNADFTFNSGTNIYTVSSQYGVFVNINYTVGSTYTGKFLQFDPQLEYYREIVLSGITTGPGSVLQMMPNGESVLQALDDSNHLRAATSGPSLTMSVPRVRSWGFSLDDHDMYVINLNDDETLLYDTVSGQWCEWNGPQSYWRANYGVNWQGMTAESYSSGLETNVVCGDNDTGTIWTLAPDQGYDDQDDGIGQDVISTRATAGLPIRGSKSYRVFRVFLTLQGGDPGVSPGTVQLQVSDDNGVTYEDCGSVTIQDTVPEQDIVWRSLGTMDQPGRIFEFSDNGSSARWDGVDVEAENMGDKENKYGGS